MVLLLLFLARAFFQRDGGQFLDLARLVGLLLALETFLVVRKDLLQLWVESVLRRRLPVTAAQ